MATTSFSKEFTVIDTDAIARFKKASNNPIKIHVKKRDYESDKTKGIQLLKQRLSKSATC